ncbi:hypothetical protein Bca52824_095539 [Brassica carinata]|uniref:Uncharacterized protein n=1 Tax=Brassica carinata TaxID=52824 RepID=A0A8X7P2C2_BRACI|nr:hypothetical protein Bca52824_095539 [Brassica carinata]
MKTYLVLMHGKRWIAVAAGAQRTRIGPIRGPRVEIGVVGFMENIIKKIQLMKVMMDLRLVSMVETTSMRPATDNLGNLKLRIPPFHGKNDPDAYLEWEKELNWFSIASSSLRERK